MRRRPDLLLVLTLLAAALPTVATAERAALPPLEPPKTGATAPNDAAVVIAIEDYTYLPDIPFAQRDGRLVHRFLTDTVGVPAERISNLYVRPATDDSILKEVRKRAAEVGPNGTLWIYFSGHGLPWRESDTTEALLVGQSATQDTIRDASVSKAELLRAAQLRAGARGTVLLLDACFSGKDRAGGNLSGAKFGGAVTMGVTPNAVVWTAAQNDQVAGTLPEVQHGLFTYFAIGALSGWAREPSGASGVRITEAQRYVDRAMRVAESVRGQPQLPQLVAPTEALGWRLTDRLGDLPRPDLDAYGRGTRKFVPVVPIPRVEPVKPLVLPAASYSDVSVAAMRVLQTAARTDRKQDATPEQRATAWEAVARHPRTSAANRRQATERAAEWRTFVAAERAREQQEAEVRARFAADREKLTELITLDDDVAPPSVKQRWRQEFAAVWTPWREVVGDDPLLGAPPSAVRHRPAQVNPSNGAHNETAARDDLTAPDEAVPQAAGVADFEAQKSWLQLSAAGYVGVLDLDRLEDGDVTFDGTQLEPLNAAGFSVSAAYSARWFQAGVGLRFAAARLTDAESAGFESISIYSTATYAFIGPQLTAAESSSLHRLTLFAHGLVGAEYLRVAGDGVNDAASIDAASDVAVWGAVTGLRVFLTPDWALSGGYRLERSEQATAHGAELGLTF